MRSSLGLLLLFPLSALAGDGISPQSMTYSALGLSTLGLAGWVVWNIAQRNSKLDARVIALIQEAVKPYQETIAKYDGLLEEERAEKRQAQAERDKLNARLVDTVILINDRHEATITQVRNESREQREHDQTKYQDGMERAHKRLDDCEKGHRLDTQTLTSVQAELREIRDRLFQVAQASSPSSFVVAPVTPAA